MVDLAVGIVIGVAFTSVVQGLVRDFINPLIAALFGKPDFSKFHFTVHHAVFSYGDFINRVLTLVIIGAAVFFLVVKPVNGHCCVAPSLCTVKHDRPDPRWSYSDYEVVEGFP